tara:strand:+ start:2292 stop:2588 length:297 start_codon:yes stop_codon:yes gene_type:complete
MTTKTQALLELCPGAEWFIQDDIIIKWYSTTIQQPTEEEINAKITELQAEYDSKQYQRDRQYPSIQEQLDMQYWDRKNGTKTWEESIDKVKTDNPKPE